MDDDWGEPTDFYRQLDSVSSYVDEGRSSGRGRGFVPVNTDDDWSAGNVNYSKNDNYGGCDDQSRYNDQDRSNDFDANSNNKSWEPNNDFGNGRSGRGGGRGGPRGGRGKGPGGRGGYRNKQENNDNSYKRNYGYDDDNNFRSGDDFDNREQRNQWSQENNYGDGNNQSSRGGRGGGRGRGPGAGGRNFENRGDPEKPKTEIYIPPELPDDENALFENGVSMGINFDKYDDIQVRVSGENTPRPIESFDEAGLRNIVLENIKKSGYTKPTPVQKHALPIIMNGRDLMACAQTGSGKTAAFAVPIINTLLEHPTDLVVSSKHCEPQVIIVSPTRELTIQISEQIKKFALHSILKTVVAYGGTSVMHQSSKLSNGCHILVATPGRLLDFLDRGRLKFSSVRFLILDEADRMLDMGFLPSIERIVDHETMVPCGERQTLMFSATFPDEVQHLASRFLNNYLFLAVGIVGGACSDVEQRFYEVTRSRKTEMLKDLMEMEKEAGNLNGTLVFVEMKRKADFIAAFLSENNYPTTSIHGDRLQRQREEALADFKAGRMSILVATAVAARGLDIRNVAHVVNYDMPKGIDEYVHRIGRTGRVGNRGRATSFFDPDADAPLRGDLVRILKQAGQEVPDWLVCNGTAKSFAPGRGNKFGGEDIRDFDEPAGEPYAEDAYAAQVEPDEEW